MNTTEATQTPATTTLTARPRRAQAIAPAGSRRTLRRRVTMLMATALAAMALLLGPMAAQSQAASLLPMTPLTRCWPYNTSGQALMQVFPPQMESVQSSVPIYVGADNQTVTYQPSLQRYDGTKWVTIVTGPVYTGVANQYGTSWYGASGGETRWTVYRASSRRYYRVVASLRWVPDSTHAGYSLGGVVEHRQYDGYGWPLVDYCTY